MKAIKMILISMVCFCIFYLPLSSGDIKNPEYENVKKALEGIIGWAIEKNFDYLYSIIANDENFFLLTPECLLYFYSLPLDNYFIVQGVGYFCPVSNDTPFYVEIIINFHFIPDDGIFDGAVFADGDSVSHWSIAIKNGSCPDGKGVFLWKG